MLRSEWRDHDGTAQGQAGYTTGQLRRRGAVDQRSSVPRAASWLL
jgi:hypothetical protein